MPCEPQRFAECDSTSLTNPTPQRARLGFCLSINAASGSDRWRSDSHESRPRGLETARSMLGRRAVFLWVKDDLRSRTDAVERALGFPAALAAAFKELGRTLPCTRLGRCPKNPPKGLVPLESRLLPRFWSGVLFFRNACQDSSAYQRRAESGVMGTLFRRQTQAVTTTAQCRGDPARQLWMKTQFSAVSVRSSVAAMDENSVFYMREFRISTAASP